MSIKEQEQYGFTLMESQTQSLKVSEEKEEGNNEAEKNPSVSTHLYLKSSRSLDKDVVIGRIQRRKCVNKVKNTFHSLLSLNGSTLTATPSIAQEQMWVDLGDSFSCP